MKSYQQDINKQRIARRCLTSLRFVRHDGVNGKEQEKNRGRGFATPSIFLCRARHSERSTRSVRSRGISLLLTVLTTKKGRSEPA